MSHIVVGVIAIVAGAVFCFRGYLAMRTVIGIWGAFVGFSLGAALGSGFSGQPLLAGVVSWVAAVLGALILGGLAYAVYAVAVILTMGSVGYSLGGAVAAWLGLPAAGFVVVGLVVAGLLVVVALMTDLPAGLLMVVTAFGGASAIVTGIALLAGLVPFHVAPEQMAAELARSVWLDAAYLVLVIAGIVTQSRRRSNASLRASYR